MQVIRFLVKTPSAYIPILMSTFALGLIIGYLVFYSMSGISIQPEKDEGTAAHIFQLLMGGQVPVIAFFAIKYLPKKPKQALIILALQFIFGLLAFLPVYILEH
jgi:uncharacterized membrane protein SpoIIM required for sporulation